MRSNERKKTNIVCVNPNREPPSPHDTTQTIATIRSQRNDFETKLKEEQKRLQETVTQLTYIQQEFQTSQSEVDTWKERTTQNHQLYLTEQQKYQQTLCLYNETQSQLLKYERESKAGIERWETQLKLENQKLKQEIGEMTILLSQSLQRKDEAVNTLYALAKDMEQNQQLVDSLRSQRDDLQFKFNQEQKCLQETVTKLTYIQQEFQTSHLEVNTWKERTAQNYQLYIGEQQNHQQVLYLYEQEKTKSTELLTKYERVNIERTQYLDLYNEIQAQPKYKRGSTDSPINLLQKLKLIWFILTE
jgi:hypothetical protein